MADFVFTTGKGRVAEKVADGATIKLLVLKASAADATNAAFANVGALIADAGNTEADFTNYARPTLTCAVEAATDPANVKVTASAVTFTDAGGATNNTTTDVVIYEEVGADGVNIPLVQLDCVFTTDGNDVTLTPSTDGIFGAA